MGIPSWIDDFPAMRMHWIAQNKALTAIRELHYPVNDGGCGDPECCSPSDSEDFCIVCGDYGYPCETIKILDGIK
jgi:hypothetical protein